MTDNWIKGFCPYGCGPTLRRREFDDKVICQFMTCPRPTAVAELLADQETEHVVQFTASGFTIRHPLRERLDDALLRCQLHDSLAALGRSPVPDGRYRTVFNRHQQEYSYEWIGRALLPGQDAVSG